MDGLLQEILNIPEIKEVKKSITGGKCRALMTGLNPVHRSMAAAALAWSTDRPLLMICADDQEAARSAADLQSLLGTAPVILPPRELQLRSIDAQK